MNSNFSYKGKISDIVEEVEDIKTFRIELDRKMEFKPGQFVNISVETDQGVLTRPYSIASSPLEKDLRITIKNRKTGGVSQYMCEKYKSGDSLDVKGPFGMFYFEDNMNPLVLLGGGVGITPLMSMLRYVKDKGLDTNVLALFSFRTEELILFRDELEELNKMNNINVIITLTREPEYSKWKGERGRFDEAKIKKYVSDDFKDGNVFLCGSLGMVNSVEDIFLKLGFDKNKIKKEGWG